MLKSVLSDGRIPYFMRIKQVLYVLAWALPFLIFLMPREHGQFATIGWWVLVGVLSVRPLAQLLPKLKLCSRLVVLRKEFGVFSGMMILAHFAGFLMVRGASLGDIFTKSFYWKWDGIFLWGILGILVLIPVLLTSNSFAMRFLNSNWKTVQRLSYFFFLFGAVHIILVGEEIGAIGLIIVVAIRLLAWGKSQFSSGVEKCE